MSELISQDKINFSKNEYIWEQEGEVLQMYGRRKGGFEYTKIEGMTMKVGRN